MFVNSYPLYLTWNILCSDRTTNISVITPSISVSVWSHTLYMSTICMTSYELQMTSHPLFMISQHVWKSSHLAHIWHHTYSTWHQIHTLWHQWSVFMASQPLHSWQKTSSIWHHIHGLWHLITYTCDITATIFVTSPSLWLWIHIHSIWHQTHCVKTIQPLYLKSHPPYLYTPTVSMI